MDRYTRKDADKAAARLAEATGHRFGVSYSDHRAGDWYGDYNAIYGGYVIEEYCSDGGGGITHPLGSTRHSPREFCEMVNFALRTLEMVRTHASA